MTAWTIRTVPVPDSLDSADAWLLRGSVEAEHASTLDLWGNLDQSHSADERLVGLRHQEYARRVRLVAVAPRDGDLDAGAGGTADPGRVLGVALLELPLADNAHLAMLDLSVRPDRRRQGIGSALYDAAARIAREAGRTTLTATTDQSSEPATGPGTCAPASGSGRVRSGDDGVRFALARGFTLAQVERFSVLDVPLEPAFLAEQRESAQAAAGTDYRVVTWADRCPDPWVDAFAHLCSRMATDVPLGEIDLAEEKWDRARVREMEHEFSERGVRLRVAAAEQVSTGDLVGHTALISVAWSDEVAHQHDTIVLSEHRGRRLGMLVKVANLQRLAVEAPATRRVGTWNAEENAHMLGINVALGFRPAGGSGQWQARLV